MLDKLGILAYTLDRPRWSEDEKAEVNTLAPTPAAFSVIQGPRSNAGYIVSRHREKNDGSPLVTMVTLTQVEDAVDKGGYDYLDQPVEITNQSYVKHWGILPPVSAEQEIEELRAEGATRRAWSGTSGGGVWNVVVRQKVNANLGICF